MRWVFSYSEKRRKLATIFIYSEPLRLSSKYSKTPSQAAKTEQVKKQETRKREREMKEKKSPYEEVVRAQTQQCSKTKPGSLMPKERRLVKSMIFDCFLSLFTSSERQQHKEATKV
ncbi:hypothetical protein MANES_02G169850v8 [Manihot esculenta]|uniref:Uncharacterized protein n=1 Tax=Manihot esculenta TaxID=3983 RepID=A0ACB7I6L1_MANES|nr:hypothetical protein MANES_02G169850v8 [Manihot esculenta]